MSLPSILRTSALASLAAAALTASPAVAGETTTRVVGCAEGSCLLVTGHRANAEAAVSINGHAVNTRGARKWRASVPVETLREWSAPLARSITISIVDGGNRTDSETRLPIGLLGQAEDLAFLVVSMK
jgi:hypothetical protein